MTSLPERKRFHHATPRWVGQGALFFLTVCCEERGTVQLTKPGVFEALARAVEHYQSSGKWWVESFLVMPDHWHALVAFQDAQCMEKSVRDWKRYTARQARVSWQDGFFEHRLRSRQSADEKWHYIRLNPVRKGLVASPDKWPFVWIPEDPAR